MLGTHPSKESPFTTLKTVKTYISPPSTTPITRYSTRQQPPAVNKEDTPPPLMLKAHPSRHLSTLEDSSCTSNTIHSKRVNQRSFKSILLQPSAVAINEQTAMSPIHQSRTELASMQKDREAQLTPYYEARNSSNSSLLSSLRTKDPIQYDAVENEMVTNENELFKDHTYVDIDELRINLQENVMHKPKETDPTSLVSEALENNYFLLKVQEDDEKENKLEESHYFVLEEAVANEQGDFDSSKSQTSGHFNVGINGQKKGFATLHNKTKTSPLLHSNTIDGSMRVPHCDYEVPIRLKQNDDFSLPTNKEYQRSFTLPGQKGASVAPTNWTSSTPSPHNASPSPSQQSPYSSRSTSSPHNTTMFSYEDNESLSLSSESLKTGTKSYMEQAKTKSPFVSPEISPPNAFVLKIPEDDENNVRYCTQDRNYFKLDEIESDSNEEDDEESQSNPYCYIDVNRKQQMLLALLSRRSQSLPREITTATSYRRCSVETSQIDYEEPISTLQRNCGHLSSTDSKKYYHSFTPKKMGVASPTTPSTNTSFSPSQRSPSPSPNQTSVFSYANKYDETCSKSCHSLPSSLFPLHQPNRKMSCDEQIQIQRSRSPTSSISSPLQSPSSPTSPLSGYGSQTTPPSHDINMLLHDSSRHHSLPVITTKDSNDDSHPTLANIPPNEARRSTLPSLVSRSPSPTVRDHFVTLLITETGPVLLPK